MGEHRRKALIANEINRPTLCQACGGVMVYQGIGEYICEECGAAEYDDYGKVRNYLEKHKGANVAEISDMTGVSHKSIRELIKEKRFDIIDNRGGYLRCEMCGVAISTGRLCPKCEESYHRKVEKEARSERNKKVSGYGEGKSADKGSKRYTREK